MSIFDKNEFNKMISQSKLDHEIKKNFLNIVNTNMENSMEKLELNKLVKKNIEKYHQCWSIIHNMHKDSGIVQFHFFKKILNLLEKCNCSEDGFLLFYGLINNDLEIFFNIRNFRAFWLTYHNFINIKLGKKVFDFNFYYTLNDNINN